MYLTDVSIRRPALSWVLSLLVSWYFSPQLLIYLSDFISNAQALKIISFVSVFLLSFVLIRAIGNLLSSFVSAIGLGIFDRLLGIIFGITWLLVFFISKYSSLSSIIATMIIPIFSYLILNLNNSYFFLIMFVLIVFTHRENIKRLLNKSESKTKIY